MKHQVLAITGCIAATTASMGIANTLPENPLGLNLGEISTNSFINKPFKGVIPLSDISYASAKDLTINLASEAVFRQIGAEKHPTLNGLIFQVVKQDGKPVILISSDQPVQLPFLNFILEIQGPEGIVFQDYTVLLDPESHQSSPTTVADISISSSSKKSTRNKQKNKHKVRSGDTLFFIAKSHRVKNVSLNKMSQAIYNKNPRAFVKGDINKIKRGYTLSLPTKAEIDNFEVASKNTSPVNKAKNKEALVSNKKISKQRAEQVINASNNNKYTVARGDTLSKITRKFVDEDNSFTKLMNAIYVNNPDAFVGKNKSLIKKGAELEIPLMAGLLKEKNDTETKEIMTDITVKSSLEPSDVAKALVEIVDDKVVSEVSTLEDNILEDNAPVALANIDKNDVVAVSSSVPESELVKRIRELRKELQQSKGLLANMEKTLNDKEALLQEKNDQLDSLKATILQATVANAKPTIEKSNLESLGFALKNDSMELGKVASVSMPKVQESIMEKESIPEQEKPETPTKQEEAITQSTESTSFDLSNDIVKLSTIQEFIGNNYAYLTLASLFGLLLIGYRRKSSYSSLEDSNNTYSALPDDETYVLKEKNINYYDRKMDEEFSYNSLDDLGRVAGEPESKLIVEPTDKSVVSTVDFETNTAELATKSNQSVSDEIIDDIDENRSIDISLDSSLIGTEDNTQEILETSVNEPVDDRLVINNDINLDESSFIEPSLVDDALIIKESLYSEQSVETESIINDSVFDYADLSVDGVSADSDFTLGDQISTSEDSVIDNEPSSLLIADVEKDTNVMFTDDFINSGLESKTDYLLDSGIEVVSHEDSLLNDNGAEPELGAIEKVLAETNEYLESARSNSLMESDNEVLIDELVPLNTKLDSALEGNFSVDLNPIDLGGDEILNDPIVIEPITSLREIEDSMRKEDTLKNNIQALNKLVDEQKSEQIEQCDDLITEFYNGLGVDESVAGDDWSNIEKVCDNYIDQYKDIEESKEEVVVEEVADFNHMMTDLLESLDKVDDNLKKAMINKGNKDPSADS